VFVGNASCWDFAHLQVCGLKNAEHLNGQTARRVDLHIKRCLEYSNPTPISYFFLLSRTRIVNYNPVNGRWEELSEKTLGLWKGNSDAPPRIPITTRITFSSFQGFQVEPSF